MPSEALYRVIQRIEADLGPIGGDIQTIPGTAPGYRLRAEIAGVGRVFIKASDGSPEANDAVGAEAALLGYLSHRSLPRLLASDPADEVPWMVQPALADRGWTPPWPTRLRPVWSTLASLSGLQPPPWLGRPDDVDPWDGLISTEDVGGHAAGLQVAAARVSISGSQLVHSDLGSGNLHAVGRRVTVVDWSDAFIGNAELDLVSVAVDIAHESGRRPDPPVQDLGAWMAKTAGLLLAAAARPAWGGPGGSAVRATQARLARTALDWAIDLL